MAAGGSGSYYTSNQIFFSFTIINIVIIIINIYIGILLLLRSAEDSFCRFAFYSSLTNLVLYLRRRKKGALFRVKEIRGHLLTVQYSFSERSVRKKSSLQKSKEGCWRSKVGPAFSRSLVGRPPPGGP